MKKKKPLKKVPLIFVPGLFGSMNDGENNSLFNHIYKPFIKMIEDFGYKQGENFFILYYDWTKKCENIANSCLYKMINEVKEYTNKEKVNIIAHGVGGLIARCYVQGEDYQDDVKQMILLATPNAGEAHYFNVWNFGRSDYHINNFYELYLRVIVLTIEALFNENKISVIQKLFPIFGDIIPSDIYGDFYFYKNQENLYPKAVHTNNDFLNKLNHNMQILEERGIEVVNISGIGYNTTNKLINKDNLKVYDQKTLFGDGEVTMQSAFCLNGENYLVYHDHFNLLLKSENIIRMKLLKQ